MRRYILVLPILLLLSCTNASTDKNEDEWLSIWNGKDLTGWHTYFNTPLAGYTNTQETTLGVDNPTQDIVDVVQLEDGSAIRISGTAFGMMFTKKEYSNYHLKLKVKWGKDKHVPKENDGRDTGLLYHGFGEPGSVYAWMNSHEMQIQEENMGDYIAIGDIEIDVPSKPIDGIFYQYDENSALRTYFSSKLYKDDGLVEPVDGFNDSYAKMYVMKSFDKENKYGDWNDLELICFGDSSVHMVNGVVVMRLFNSRKMSDKSSLKSGKIGFQSEGAEVFYKDIKLKRIDKMPVL